MEEKDFTYKGLSINRADWEDAPFPIDMGKLSDCKMQNVVEDLYNILDCQYRFTEKELSQYGSGLTDFERYYDLDCAFWQEYEDLVLKYGATYYEDEEEDC